MSEPMDQIAAEAAWEIINEARLPIQRNHEAFSAIIKTAIEKVERDAFQRGWNDREARIGAENASERKEGDALCPANQSSSGSTDARPPGSEAAPTFDPKVAAHASEPLGTTGAKVELAEHFNLVRASEPPSKEQVDTKGKIMTNERDARVRYISESHPALNPSGAHASEPFPKNREEMNATHKAQQAALVSEWETLDTLRLCRDHWKTSWQHERDKVIRLSNQIYAIHGSKCICTICELVRTKGNPPNEKLSDRP